MAPLFVLLIIVIFFLASTFKILSEWDRAVVLRFGRSMGIRGPGLIIVIPLVERIIRIDTRTITMDIQPQDIITKDNVTLKVNAVIYFRVIEPEMAVTQVEDFFFATSQLAQTTLRSVLGQYQLDELLTTRDKINQSLQEILDKATEPWGVKITLVEVKHIDLPKEMQRAMAREAEAERERRAKVISAEGENAKIGNAGKGLQRVGLLSIRSSTSLFTDSHRGEWRGDEHYYFTLSLGYGETLY